MPSRLACCARRLPKAFGGFNRPNERTAALGSSALVIPKPQGFGMAGTQSAEEPSLAREERIVTESDDPSPNEQLARVRFLAPLTLHGMDLNHRPLGYERTCLWLCS
jgi:hypothetical protein